jgi:RecA-family ATPase
MNTIPFERQDTQSLETFCAADFEGVPVPRRQWLVDKIIPHINVTLLSGDGGLGKTILALMLGTSLSARTSWLGMETMQGPFLYIGAEDDEAELHRRLEEIRIELGHSWGDLADFYFRSFAGEDALLGTFDRSAQAMRATPMLGKIETRIEEIGAIACVLDTSADVFGGEEINRTQVRQFVGMLRGVCIRRRASIILLSHPSLSGMASGSGTSGSTAWNNSVRSRLYLDADGDARLLKFMKSNYGPKAKPMRLLWQNGIFVPDDGKASATAQLNAETKFMQMLDTYAEQGRPVSASASSNYAPTIFSRDPACKGFPMRTLQEAMNTLFAKKQISLETFGPPSKPRTRIVKQ